MEERESLHEILGKMLEETSKEKNMEPKESNFILNEIFNLKGKLYKVSSIKEREIKLILI